VRRIGDYEVLAEIARGGYGAVYRAAHRQTGREVAIKLLLGGSSNPVALRRLRREAEVLARLRHRGVVAIHEVGECPSGPYLVLALVDGVTLAQRLESGPLEPDDAAWIARALADALAHAHEAGVLHRDVKPSNVLIDSEGAPRLTDFGLAREIDADSGQSRLSLTGQLMGTPGYLPPEQAQGDLDAIGPPADVYALGATLFEMLTGRPPFVGESLHAVLSSMFKPPPRASSLNSAVPAELDEICARCLERKPERRYPHGAALRDALETYLHGERAPAKASARIFAVALGSLALGLLLAALLIVGGGATEPATSPPPTSSSSPAALPWPAPPSGWGRLWSLSQDRVRSPAPELWEEVGHVAAPNAAVAAGDGVEAAFFGPAEALGDGRVRVSYRDRRFFTARLVNTGDAFEHARGLIGLAAHAEGVEVTAPNDSGPLLIDVGRAWWAEPRLSIRLRELPDPPHLIDGGGLTVWLGGLRQGGVGASFRDRHQTLVTTVRTERGSSLSHPFDLPPDEWVSLVFEPGAAVPDRVKLDGVRIPTLGEHIAGPVEGPVRLEASEHHVLVGEVLVEGRPLRPDRPALTFTLAGGPPPQDVCVTAAFEAEADGHGGPLLALGAGRLEMAQGWLVLQRGGVTVGRAPLPGGRVPERGVIRLERRGDVLRATLTTRVGVASFAVGDPLPRRGPATLAYGSTGRRVRFTRVEVHGGEGDPFREAFEAAAQEGPRAALQVLEEGPVTPQRDWWLGSASLARVTRVAWARASALGPAARGQRVALARQAGDLLASAAAALPQGGEAQLDAWARAVLAWVVVGDPQAAERAARALVAAAGEDPARGRVALDMLLPSPWPDAPGGALHQLRWGYVTTRQPLEIREAAARALLALAPPPEEEADATHVLAKVAHGQGRHEEALALNDQAGQGADPADPRFATLRAEILLSLKRWEDALASLDLIEQQDWWLWLYRCQALVPLERWPEALVACLGALRDRNTPDVARQAVALARKTSQRRPGLAAAALASVHARAPLDETTRRLAEGWAQEAGVVGSPVEACLGGYALQLFHPGNAWRPPLDGLGPEDAPIGVLFQAKVGDERALAELLAAAQQSRIVLVLAKLDPDLRPHLR
jgi:tetratricopeptide (TPR) repeat protein